MPHYGHHDQSETVIGWGIAMYQPPSFREDRIEVQQELIRAYPLGLLITAGPGGLMANPVPFLLDAEGSSYGTLRAHVARANPQWQEFAAIEECLVVFQGPQEYITPAWYATKRETGKVVPTWNYATVHAWGRPRLVEDGAWLHRQLQDLTLQQECGRTAPWKVEDAPEEYVAALVKGIVGMEIPIDRMVGKWKVSQNRPEADRAGVVVGLREQGERSEPMAALVAERAGL
jgi:transcriptional regulator